jgi:hypothetical protein
LATARSSGFECPPSARHYSRFDRISVVEEMSTVRPPTLSDRV